MALRIEQRLMFVLPVQLDERRGRIGERRRRDEHVVQKRAAASLRVDVAPNDERWADLKVGTTYCFGERIRSAGAPVGDSNSA